MPWSQIPLCFELLSPLHIGFLPNQPGTVLAPTRCYVPGKNIWGAVTENAAHLLYTTPTATNFAEVGDALRQHLVFSYLYFSDGTTVYTPIYSTGEELHWGTCTDRAFRTLFLASRVSTAIDASGGAKDGSLHELEYVRHRLGEPGRPSTKTLLIGALWVQDGFTIGDKDVLSMDGSIAIDRVDLLAHLTIGGDRNSGFGAMLRVSYPSALELANPFKDWTVTGHLPESSTDPATIAVAGSLPLLGHLAYDPSVPFVGDIEVLSGREYISSKGNKARGYMNPGQNITTAGLCFTPGTRLIAGVSSLKLDAWGRLQAPSTEYTPRNMD